MRWPPQLNGFLFIGVKLGLEYRQVCVYCFNKILDDTSLDKVTTEIMNISYSKGGDYSEEVIRKFAIVYIDVFLWCNMLAGRKKWFFLANAYW